MNETMLIGPEATFPSTFRAGYHPGMTILLPALAVAFAAFCIWLMVRIINRRERWAKWTLAAVLSLPVLYVLSFGPACWISSHANVGVPIVNVVYLPMMWFYDVSPGFIQQGILWYARLGCASGWYWTHGNEWKDYGREGLLDGHRFFR